MSSVRKSLLLGFAQNYGAMIFQLAGTMIVARLLTPSEVGVFSVAVVLVGLVQTVRAFGVPTYIVQEKELTEERIRSAMGVAILVGWVLAAAIALLSGLVAGFYREPGIRDVMLVLALNFVLMPFGSVTMAYLMREMNFAPQALATVLAAAAQCGVAVTLAWLGFGYMSLAWASVASNLVMIVVAQVYRPAGMPYRPSLKGAKRIAKFGMTSTSAFVIGDATHGAPDLVMGRTIGVEAVAIFGRASGLVQMFDKVVMNAVWRVAMPYFSMRDREGGNVTVAFLNAASLTTALAWPFFFFLAVMAYPVIRIMYGPQWDASVPLVPWLCAAGAISAPFVLSWSVLIATGQVGKILRPLILGATVQVGTLVVASHWGVEVVAQSFVGTALFGALVWYVALQRVLAFSLGGFVRALRRSAGVALCASVVPAVAIAVLPPGPGYLWPPLLVGSVGAAIGWLAGVLVLRHPFRDELAKVVGRFRRRER